jgi:hypothetical protein
MTEHSGPTLTDAKGMGGVNAQDGFDYQVWDAVVRLPAWLRLPVFEGITVEGLEDVEVRFFAPHAPRGHLLDRFQAKSAQLTRSPVIDVFEAFAVFDDAHPGAARAHVLVTPSLPRDLQWLEKDSERVRRARPFFAPFPDVIAASDEKLYQDIVAEFGPELGPRIARSFDVSSRVFPDRTTAEAMFAGALEQAFPAIEPSRRKVADAFGSVATHLATNRGRMVTRSTLLALLAESLGMAVTSEGPLPVHVRSDRNAPLEDAVEIDASAFSGRDGPTPATEEWKASLLAPLERTATWAHRNGQSRVRITGSYRISTAFALGWSFRAATGFELEIPTRGGDWVTDDRPGPHEAGLPWEITAPTDLHDGRLVVSIGVLRDPAPDVQTALGLVSGTSVLRAYLGQPITSGREAQHAAQTIKNAVAGAVTRLAPKSVDLFFAGPVALAMVIGHRWNAMPSTQLYEYRPAQGYVASAVLP